MYDVMFFACKVYIFWKLIQYKICRDETQVLKNFPSDKIDVTKNTFFFFRELQFITVLLFIRDSLWAEAQGSVRFSIFDSVSFLSKFIFLFNKKNGLSDVKTSQFISKLK